MTLLQELRRMVTSVWLGDDGNLHYKGAGDEAKRFMRIHKAALVDALEREAAMPSKLPPSWPAGKTRFEMIGLFLGLIDRLGARVGETGDAACLAIDQLGSGLAAIRDNEIHGRRWFAKYGLELGARLRPLLPEIWPPAPVLPRDRMIEGEDLVRAAEDTFGCAHYVTDGRGLTHRIKREPRANPAASDAAPALIPVTDGHYEPGRTVYGGVGQVWVVDPPERT